MATKETNGFNTPSLDTGVRQFRITSSRLWWCDLGGGREALPSTAGAGMIDVEAVAAPNRPLIVGVPAVPPKPSEHSPCGVATS